jgi:hypothetical protein
MWSAFALDRENTMSPSLRSLREKSSYPPLWLLVPVCLSASLLMAALSVHWLNSTPEGTAAESADEAGPAAPDPVIAAEVAHDVRRFAVNALVVPVLDEDGTPARWHDPSLAVPCQPGSQVFVNGRPIEPRSEVIGPEFTVSWVMEGCLPLGAGGPEWTGAAEVIALRDDGGLSTIVQLRNLHVRHRGQELVLDTTFAAHLP